MAVSSVVRGAQSVRSSRSRSRHLKNRSYRNKSSRFSGAYKSPEKTVLVGGGQLAIPTAIETLNNGNYLILHTNQIGDLEKALMSANPTRDRYKIVRTTYEQGKDSQYWQEQFVGYLSNSEIPIRVVNTRGVSVLPSNASSFREVNATPAIALTQGLIAARDKAPQTQCALVHISSTAAAVPGFTEKNDYAESRKFADTTIQELANKHGQPGCTIQCDYAVTPPSETFFLGPNHGASFEHLTAAPVHFVVAHPDSTLAMQPVSQRQLLNAIVSPKLYEQDYITIIAAGPVAYSQIQIYQFYANVLGKTLRIIPLPTSVAEWTAKHIQYAQMAYGIPLLLHRAECPEANQPFDSAPFQQHVGEPLETLPQIYVGNDEALLQVRSPLMTILGKGMEKLKQSPEARKDLRILMPEIPGLLFNTAKAVVSGMSPQKV